MLGDDDIVEGARLDVVPAGGNDGACVKAALAPVADEVAKDRNSSRGDWSGNVVVTVQAP